MDPSLIRHGRVNGRYFRENFAQGEIDMVQIVPELVTNADSAIALGGRPSGRIVLRFGAPDPEFVREWKRAMRRLRAPALLDWRLELRCSDDGIGIVRHRANGWVSEIARKDEDALMGAHFDPESGVVTVYEGRPELKAHERAARRAGFKPTRVREYLPYRMLEVEAAANAVYHWAAEQIVARRLAGELRNDPVEYAHALRHETQSLRHRAHERLMRAFLDPEVFTGGVRVVEDEPPEAQTQLTV